MAFFRSREPRPATEKIENVMGPSADFKGELKAEGGIRIDGAFEGTVESQSNVIIGENARVVAGISAFHVTVAGFVEGNVKAVGRLEILSTGRVLGDVQVGSLLIEEGGIFHGKSLMAPPADDKANRSRKRSTETFVQEKQEHPPESGTRTDVSEPAPAATDSPGGG